MQRRGAEYAEGLRVKEDQFIYLLCATLRTLYLCV